MKPPTVKGGPEQYETVMDEVMEIAWDAAPLAMKLIAEAATDGDINAAYYLINRTMGRPPEAPKEKPADDYGDVLRDLRRLRASEQGSEQPSSDDGGKADALAAGGVPPEPDPVGSTHEPSET